MANIVEYHASDSIATITMDDGKVNALSLAMLTELNRALDQALADKAIVILTGRAGVFSAGFDLAVVNAGGEAAGKMVKAGFEMSERLLSFPTPVVIACSGHAIAMGVFLVLSVDYRIGVEGPFKIGANEVAIGLTMPHAGIEICRQRLAPSHFNRAVICSEFYAPDEAVAAGFLDKIVPVAELSNATQNAAAQFAKLDMAAHTATKLRLREHSLQTIRQAIESDAAEFQARNTR